MPFWIEPLEKKNQKHDSCLFWIEPWETFVGHAVLLVLQIQGPGAGLTCLDDCCQGRV